jgi:hypothetical protein
MTWCSQLERLLTKVTRFVMAFVTQTLVVFLVYMFSEKSLWISAW